MIQVPQFTSDAMNSAASKTPLTREDVERMSWKEIEKVLFGSASSEKWPTRVFPSP